MPAPIALQLYSVREAAAKDYAGTVRKVAAMGYVGVETAGFPGTTYQEAAKLFKELGLAVPSGHFPLPVGERKNEVLDMAHTLGCSYIGVGGLPGGHENWKTLDSIKKACDLINEASANVKAHGFPFQYHNHWAEYEKIGDRRVDEIMLELLDPDVMLQLDT
jgi:sugar phosphate isomerase/epimerase